ncbi:hypothetical protein [Krasilnikovia sp. M28-CT-15]|uniref:hypothetical protein n=1 Tax=Krasilnikovia sp. M28-CT-15 TaxID=3373540 RepID=UPI00399D356F
MRVLAPIAVFFLAGTAVATWLGVPSAAEHAAFGRVPSALVLIAAIVASVVGAVLTKPSINATTRRRTAAALTALAVATTVLGFNHLAKSAHLPETMLGIYLWLVTLALASSAIKLVRTS